MDKAQALVVVSEAVQNALEAHESALRIEVGGAAFNDLVSEVAEHVVRALYAARREEDRAERARGT